MNGLPGTETIKPLIQNTFYQPVSTIKTETGTPLADDKISLGTLTPEKTQALLNRQLAEKVQAALGEEGISLEGLQPEDFTPENTARRILGFIEQRMTQENDTEKRGELVQQARAGIEQGFTEARNILQDLGALQGKIEEDIDKTYNLIQQGLESLEQGKSLEQTSPANGATVNKSFSRSENSSIKINTRDGDVVTINIFREQSGSSNVTYGANEQGVILQSSTQFSASSAGISYTVEGNLDKDEHKAIDNLLKDIQKVSRKFYSGDIQKAFNAAQKIDFDTDELSSFAVNLSYSQQREVAVSTYNQVQNTAGHSRENSEEHNRHAPGGLGGFINDLNRLLDHPSGKKLFEHPARGIADLFKDVNKFLRQETRELEQGSGKLLDTLLEHMVKFREKQQMADEPVVETARKISGVEVTQG